MAQIRDLNRAKKTLYVTGFNPKHTTKQLLKELFTQGGPVADITMFDTHAYVLFQHEVSVPYCLALFNEVELHGEKLRLNPRLKSKETFSYLNHLSKVRTKFRDYYKTMPAPSLPQKIYPKKKARKPISNSKARSQVKQRTPTKKRVKGPTIKSKTKLKRPKKNKQNASF